ncbi:hypothetical protein CVT26_004494 [Gymnopilus dilepis]|uniref:Uncharacterized protein n=1 Tax=Gymnopilus dilepis TaxID=231916 RepID=A0A409XCU5_9AGAR|nr:hypothetical protein CVT26_004494 [Gymnopilus dilepis]
MSSGSCYRCTERTLATSGIAVAPPPRPVQATSTASTPVPPPTLPPPPPARRRVEVPSGSEDGTTPPRAILQPQAATVPASVAAHSSGKPPPAQCHAQVVPLRTDDKANAPHGGSKPLAPPGLPTTPALRDHPSTPRTGRSGVPTPSAARVTRHRPITPPPPSSPPSMVPDKRRPSSSPPTSCLERRADAAMQMSEGERENEVIEITSGSESDGAPAQMAPAPALRCQALLPAVQLREVTMTPGGHRR